MIKIISYNPCYKRTAGEFQTSTAPPVWTMQFLSDVVSPVSWDGLELDTTNPGPMTTVEMSNSYIP